MELRKEVKLLGRKIALTSCSKERLKGVSVGEKLSNTFYDGFYCGEPMLFVEPKHANPTPKECDIIGERLSRLFGLPTVFILSPGPTYERQRLLDKGVYFIMSDKYAHLPMFVAMEKTVNRQKATALTSVAQYLLLYHLQVHSIEGLSAQEIAPLVPYSYESTTLGITCLTDVGLCEKIKCGQRIKTVHFDLKGAALWEKAQSFLQSPIEQHIYCDGIHTDTEYPTCGVNALAHYSQLNADPECMIMIPAKDFRNLKLHDALDNPNYYDGDVMVEVWKYPSVAEGSAAPHWVDKLSLALSLREENDARVENEVERMIKEIVWKD